MRSPLASPFRGGWRNLTPMRGRGRGGANPWTPAMLPPYAWYDAELGQPKNVGYVQLAGTAGDNVSTPDSAALSFSGDIEVVMRVRVTDWSTGSGQTLCGKYVSTGNQRSWRFYVSSTGSIGLSVSQDGTSSVTTVTVTPTVALADDAWVWLRVRLDLSNGTNSVGTLETAADTGDNVEPASWTANGTNTGTTIATVFDSTAALEIGAFAAGTLERLAGRVGRCIVRNGFGGTTVADFNADDCYGDGYTHTDGYRWTLGIPKIYDRSGNDLAPATFGSGSNQPKWLPWLGVSCVHLEAATAGTNSISCTAPVGAASYVARSRDYPNVVDATGAAAAGAFTFTTAGQWQYVSILNGSAVEVARFDASLCTQTGMTDSYLVAWTINRGTAGRKTVVQSPAARSARSRISRGSDDLLTMPTTAMPPMSNSDPWTAGAVIMPHATVPSGARILDDKASTSNSALGLSFRYSGSNVLAVLGDGTNSAITAGAAPTNGVPNVVGVVASTSEVYVRVNSVQTAATARPANSQDSSATPYLGAIVGPTAFIDDEFIAEFSTDSEMSAIEWGLMLSYYGGGL